MRSAVVPFVLGALAAPLATQIDPATLAGMQCRSIGPAGMSGRVVALDAAASDPNLIWVGTGTGGAWKSTNGGVTFEPKFDDQPAASIGAVAICPSRPEVVWVGTGEANPRNSASVGNGIYRTTDGGETWTHLGLEATEHIGRIALHPDEPNTAWVTALGRAWGENAERGVFKTTDGGATWTKVLYVDERTGAADLALDPTNPDKLFAAMWDFRREPHTFRSGGPGSGLHVTRDGGATWMRLGEKEGLPKGELGRIGVAIAPSEPSVVYALIEAKKNVLLRSSDGGLSFQVVNREDNVAPRPFYYADLAVDPQLPDRIYNIHSTVTVSDDGGRTFRPLVPYSTVHPDHHAMWIDPNRPAHILDGNDGGVYISEDRGATWRFVSNLPLAQFYHARVDMDVPFNVYGGLQDNGSWKGPSTVWENAGIRNHHWREVGFGDGFDTLPDPEDSMRGYAMSQEGYLSRWDLRTGERKNIRPAPHDDTALRFNWNAGIAQDPFDAGTIYFGSQFVHRSRDRGESWEVISDDLTSNNPQWQKQAESGGLTIDATGAENYCSIVALAPSKVTRGVLWVGTDDGRLHVSRDAGETWTSVEHNLPDVPANTWIPHIEPSHFDAGGAFVVLDDHRRSNWTPYVFATSDYGASWKSLAADNVRGYCLSFAQDPVAENLLFLGTEFGLWISVDGGDQWMQWTHNFPTVAVRDLIVHPRDHDLVIATHGRAIWILDDVRPLRGLTDQVLSQPLHLFPIPAAQQYRVRQTDASRFPGHTEFRGTVRPYGALLTFVAADDDLPTHDELSDRPQRRGGGDGDSDAKDGDGGKKDKKIEVRVLDADGEQIRKFDQPVHRGVNRITWDLRTDGPRQPRGNRRGRGGRRNRGGPEVLPGTYTIALKLGDHEAQGTVEVLADPRETIDPADRAAKMSALRRTRALQEAASEMIERLERIRGDVGTILGRVRPEEGEEPEHPQLTKEGKELRKALDEIEKRLRTPEGTKGITRSEHVSRQIGAARGALGSSRDAPTEAQLRLIEIAETQLRALVADFNAFEDKRVAAFRAQVEAAGIRLLGPNPPIEIK